jgi:phosphodiesterase/alkaline phosphatase D-like protein
MPRTFFALGILIAAAGHLFPPKIEAAGNVIVDGPTVERATATSAIIGWTTKNPGGTDLHYAIAHYGTSSQNVAETAKSPNRRNRDHADMTFRVLLQGLKPGTTYYYWVESAQANGNTDGVRSRTSQFTTPHSP